MTNRVIQKNNIGGAWSIELLGTLDLLELHNYGGYSCYCGYYGYLYFQEEKI